MFRHLITLFLIVAGAGIAYGQSQTTPATTVTNQTLITFPSGNHAFKIVTLPASTESDFDHLHLLVTLGGWGNTDQTSYDMLFGDRNGLGYLYTVRGGGVNPYEKVAAYSNTDGTVDIWLLFAAVYGTASFTVLENAGNEDIVYASPPDSGSVTSSGSLLFDTSSPSYPPVSSTTYDGTLTVDNDLVVSGRFMAIGPGGGALWGDTVNTVIQPPTGGNIYLAPIGTDGTRVAQSDGSFRLGGPGQPGAKLYFPDGTSQTTAATQSSSTSLNVQGSNGLGLIVTATNLDPAFGYQLGPLANSGKLLLGWNAQVGRGEQDFIANRGSGNPGGFVFWDYSNTGALKPIFSMDALGNTAVTGNFSLTAGSGSSMTFQDNTVQSTAWNGTTLGGDYAESIDVQGVRATYEPGDLIALDPSSPGKFIKPATSYSTLIAGVYSTKPGLVGRRLTSERINKTDEVPMAMMGIAPVKVSAENGPVTIGDLLVSSSTPGYAMKGTDRDRLTGAVIGKSMGVVSSGTKLIEVLISLQ